MKLISLYVDNFGKLSDFSYDFQAEMNSFYEENGWGKTTLTVFIKSMLYGISKTERTIYVPWKNIVSFGGYLVLEANGRTYRIERQFSTQKASLDTFKIYDLKTNLPLNNFSSNVGEIILNLNEASFERSVFIPQKDLNEGFGSDIEAKLANLIGGTDDSQTFEDALNILKEKSHELKLNQKKGLIIDKKMELAQIDDEIAECNKRMEGLPLLQNQINKINENIHILGEEKKQINNRILLFTKTQEKRAKLSVKAKYEEDIQLTKNLLEDNNKVFNGHNVSLEEVLAFRSKNKELQNLRTQYEVRKQSDRTSIRMEKLEKDINPADLPDEETLEHITDQIMKYNNIKSVITAHKTETKERVKPKAGITLTIISTILLIAGVILVLFGSSLFTKERKDFLLFSGMGVAIAAILGYVGALAAFIVTNQKNNAIQVGGQVKAYDYEKIHLEEEIREFFAKYHMYSSDFTKNLFTVRTNIQRYKDAQADYLDLSLENQALENKIKEYENAIQHFLGMFNSSESCQTNEEKIGELNTHLRKKKEIEAQLQEKETLLKEFILSNGLDKIDDANFSVEELNIKISEIDNKIDELNASKTTYLNKYSEYENEIAMLDEYLFEKEDVEKEIRRLEEEYRLISLAMDYLTESQNSLLSKYVAPMKDSVNKYLSLLIKDRTEYNIDVNFNFQFMTTTGLKGIDSYSRGYQTIIQLCMRLALIDCLYPQEKPFIILDDPFVNLDDDKLELGKALIRTISRQYQIMYFSCHKSRDIEARPRILSEKQVNATPLSIKASVEKMYSEEPKPVVTKVTRAPKLSEEDKLLDELTRTDVKDVRPAQVKPIVAKKVVSTTKSETVAPRTIKINKKA